MTQAPIHDGFPASTREDVADDSPPMIANHLRVFKVEMFDRLDKLENRIEMMLSGFGERLMDLLSQQQLHTKRIDRHEVRLDDHERRVAHLEKPQRRRAKRRGKRKT